MLCELTTVKNRLGIAASDTADDTILTNAILAASARFDNHCGRSFERVVDAMYEFDSSFIDLCPDLYPIESVSSFALKDNEDDGFIAQDGVDYVIRKASGGVKCVISLAGSLGTSRQRGQITYTGGYVTPDADAGAGQTALPDDVEQACVEQVCFWYQRRRQLGITGQTVEGGGIQLFRELDLLPSVKKALQDYKRIVI